MTMGRGYCRPVNLSPMTDKPNKLRPDVNEVAHRVMLEATGQAEKTPPPEERSEDEKNPEAVERGKKGGEARADTMSEEEREAAARAAEEARLSDSGELEGSA